ncbi:hypothetical protein [Alienimonas sp. DA493]|uniref:hypothetical protein n=1 Tax=Alienimonas sp. DA493 TaxID=3373605 RepID=UPI0037550ED9
MEISAEQFNSYPLCDAVLDSITWINDGRDVSIGLRFAAGSAVLFRFEWVDQLRIELTQNERQASQPLSWDCAAENIENGRKRISLDFSSQGSMSFRCNTIAREDT